MPRSPSFTVRLLCAFPSDWVSSVTVGHQTVMGVATFFGTTQPGEFDLSREYLYQDQLHDTDDSHPRGTQFAVVQFETPLLCPRHCIVIGSKLDTDIHANICRIAFHGRLLLATDLNDPSAPRPKVFKPKQREGEIERVMDKQTVIARGFFKKETNMDVFLNLKVRTVDGTREGIIEGTFGTKGKVKIHFPDGIAPDASGKLVLHFKKFLFDDKRRMVQ